MVGEKKVGHHTILSAVARQRCCRDFRRGAKQRGGQNQRAGRLPQKILAIYQTSRRLNSGRGSRRRVELAQVGLPISIAPLNRKKWKGQGLEHRREGKRAKAEKGEPGSH